MKCHRQMMQIMLWKYSLLRRHHQNRYWNVITKWYKLCYENTRYWDVITKIVTDVSSRKSLLKCHHQNRYWNVITKFVSKTLSPTRLVSEMLSPKSLVKCHHHIQISQEITTKNLRFYLKTWKMLILSKISKIMNKNWSNIQLCRPKFWKLT